MKAWLKNEAEEGEQHRLSSNHESGLCLSTDTHQTCHFLIILCERGITTLNLQIKNRAKEDGTCHTIAKPFIFYHVKLSCLEDCAFAHRKARLMSNTDFINLSQ